MKRRLPAFLLAGLVLAAAVFALIIARAPSSRRAERRVLKFVEAINYEFRNPELIYPYLDSDYREQLTEEEFSEAFTKERSYPYLTPLFLNFESLSLEPGKRSGVARFSQAARLPGMFVNIAVIYEEGNYFFRYFEEFLDGSYLNKFERLSAEGH